MNNKFDLSVIIVNYNTPDLSRAAVESCLSESSGLHIEIIVIDNNSKKKFDPEYLNRKNVLVVHKNENRGFAAAVNEGIKMSRAKYCLLLNSDARVCKGAIHKMINCLDILENTACVGGKIKGLNKLTEVSYGHFPNLVVEFRLKIFKILLNKISFIRKSFEKEMSKPKRIDWVSGAFMMLKKDLFDKIDGFDENYFLYFEDIDFCERISQKGYYVNYLPSAECIHERGKSVENLPLKDSLKIKRKSQKRFYKKFNNPVSNLLLKLVTYKR